MGEAIASGVSVSNNQPKSFTRVVAACLRSTGRSTYHNQWGMNWMCFQNREQVREQLFQWYKNKRRVTNCFEMVRKISQNFVKRLFGRRVTPENLVREESCRVSLLVISITLSFTGSFFRALPARFFFIHILVNFFIIPPPIVSSYTPHPNSKISFMFEEWTWILKLFRNPLLEHRRKCRLQISPTVLKKESVSNSFSSLCERGNDHA